MAAVVALATTGLVGPAVLAPVDARSAPDPPVIDILTTEAVGYAAFYDSNGDRVPDTPFRPLFTAQVRVVCPVGVVATLGFLPVTSHQSPTARFTCTGGPQVLEVLPASGQAGGVVRMEADLRLPDAQGTQVVVAQDVQDVRITDVRPFPPRAPGLTVGEVTAHTVALHWTLPPPAPPAPPGGEIGGYRFGWVSLSGLPQPEWRSTIIPTPPNPLVMTNLCAGCTYRMWVEAVTAMDVGERAWVEVTTTSTPPPVVQRPSPPRSLAARPGRRRAHLTWLAPALTGGAVVDRYCVRQSGRAVERCTTARAMTVRGLRKRVTYIFAVRAHNAAGWSNWSNAASVRPRR